MQYGRLMLDVAGLTLSTFEKQQLEHEQVGGVILFSRNYRSKAQLCDLVSQIRQHNSRLVIAVDQEGGRVQRFREGFVRLPAMLTLSAAYQIDPQEAMFKATELGWLMASELVSMDIDISFAPVLDLHWAHSKVIGDRSFGGTKAQVSDLALSFVRGMRQAGMCSTGKHFPGHGWAAEDSHHQIATDERSFAAIEKDDLQPFRALIEAGLDAVMPAHVIYSEVDDNPAGFSKHWLVDVLRERLQFDGVVFSDDLNMSGAFVADQDSIGQYAARAMAAINAGCDTVLLCNNPVAATQVLGHFDHCVMRKSSRLGKMRRRNLVLDLARFDSAKEIARQLHANAM